MHHFSVIAALSVVSFLVEFVFHKMAAIKLVHVQVARSLNRLEFLRHLNDKKAFFL